MYYTRHQTLAHQNQSRMRINTRIVGTCENRPWFSPALLSALTLHCGISYPLVLITILVVATTCTSFCWLKSCL